jgi:hypothetical protein
MSMSWKAVQRHRDACGLSNAAAIPVNHFWHVKMLPNKHEPTDPAELKPPTSQTCMIREQ